MEERLNRIDSMADSIRNLFGEDLPKIVCFNEIVSKLEGEIQEEDNNINTSYIIKKDDTFIIRVSEKLNEKEKRLMLAFELGNLFIHMGYKVEPEKWNGYENDKIYVNDSEYKDEISLLFGVAFLTPKRSFIDIMKENYEGDGIYNIKSVAEYFNVEEKVIVVRGRNLGLLAKGESN